MSSECKTVVIYSGVAWNSTLQRHHKLARSLINIGFDVVFYESIKTSRFSFRKLRDFIKSYSPCRLNDRVENEIPAGMKIKKVFNVNPQFGFNWINDISLFFSGAKGDFNNCDFVVVYTPTKSLLNLLKKSPDKIIYDYVRDFNNWQGYSKSLKRCFEWFLVNSNLVLCDSYYNKKKASELRDDRVFQLLPTVNEDSYSLGRCEYASTIINLAYFGSISSHVDTEVFCLLKRAGYCVDVYGVMEESVGENCFNYKGFVKTEKDLIDKLLGYDAIIIPYKLDSAMDGVIPAKIMQALSTFKPVIVSFFYDSHVLEKYCYVYRSREEVVVKLKEAELVHKEKLTRIKDFVRDNSDKSFDEKVAMAVKMVSGGDCR